MVVKNTFRFLVLNSSNAVIKESVDIIIDSVKSKPNLVLGLATGDTMIPLYKELVNQYKERKISFSKVRTFNLDEYHGLESTSKKSYRSFMNKNLFNHININKKNINFLDGTVKNYNKECLRYEKKIKSLGGIDLQILGIGANGHIGFNEPGSKTNSLTRRVRLSMSTRKANKHLFKSESVPQYALTMGIKTIMASKKIILLATGKDKAKAVKKSAYGRITTRTPASILRKHPDVSFILDKNSASSIKKLI